MRRATTILLLAAVAAAQPPAVNGFRRLRVLRDDVASRITQLKQAEEFALKPAEEKMLLAFENGEKKFENEALTGKLVVTTILTKWEVVQRAELDEAGKRVLEELPKALFKRYAQAIEVPKDRKEVSKILCDALDSDFIHIRVAAFESLKLMYRTPSGFFYVPTMSKKERQEPIKSWKKLIAKQK